ncbi:MAG: hypothetical protein II943_09265 [Victivallales bacterium]|nr:hypothetical protein [Victivallales bacterium]
MISPSLIEKIRQRDLPAMAELDAMGISPSPNETAKQFADRLEGLNLNFAKMEDALHSVGEYTVEGVAVKASARIPEEIFAEPLERTSRLFGFRCEWVPGFFFPASPLSFFGGYAFYFFPEFFAMFLARSEFRKRQKWLFIGRDELVSHEMCHIARAALESHAYEELFAYQTATTAFRRFTGGIFREQLDSFLFLGATFLLLFWQMTRAFAFPLLPAWPGWAILVIDVAFLMVRHCRTYQRFTTARDKLTRLYGDEATARAVLFHASDDEIPLLAKTKDLPGLLDRWAENQLRWQIVRHRFPWSPQACPQ